MSSKQKNIKENSKEDYSTIEWDEILNEKNIDFILTTPQIKKILEKIGNKVDDEGYIINIETGERVLAIDSDEVKPKQIGAVLPGSKIFIKKNIAGFSQYLTEEH